MSQALTLRLLQLNRNPEPITFDQSHPEAVGAAALVPVSTELNVRPQPVNQVPRPSPGIADKKITPAIFPATNGSDIKGYATPKASHEGMNIKVGRIILLC